jgi:plasmid stabilization system protein ParE
VRVRDAILASINLLQIRPAIGIHIVGELGLRSKLVVGYPYRIHFRIRDGALEILHIRHTARRPWQGTEE